MSVIKWLLYILHLTKLRHRNKSRKKYLEYFIIFSILKVTSGQGDNTFKPRQQKYCFPLEPSTLHLQILVYPSKYFSLRTLESHCTLGTLGTLRFPGSCRHHTLDNFSHNHMQDILQQQCVHNQPETMKQGLTKNTINVGVLLQSQLLLTHEFTLKNVLFC